LTELLAKFEKPESNLVFKRGKKRIEHFQDVKKANLNALFKCFKFKVGVKQSKLPNAGMGVFVIEGCIR